MGLTNSQYDAVMRVYDKRRINSHHVEEERRRIAYEKIPELQNLDRAVVDSALSQVRRSLSPMDVHAAGGVSVPFRDLLKKAAGGEDPSVRRRQLLKAHGFPEDYLDPVYVCPVCKDTGYVGSQRCSCFDAEVIRLFYTQSNLAGILEQENFDTFDISYYPEDLLQSQTGRSSREIAENALFSCRRFADQYKSGAQNDFLLLTGQTGVGKTFLTHCIARELLGRGFSVIYYSAGELFDKLADVRFSKETDASQEILDDKYLSGCDLLIIDDLGTEMVNAFVGSALFQLLNSRIAGGLGIVISTNLSMQELSRTYSERISSRILEHFTLIEMFGRDIRVQKRLRGSRPS